jgi:hypothetical protein
MVPPLGLSTGAWAHQDINFSPFSQFFALLGTANLISYLRNFTIRNQKISFFKSQNLLIFSNVLSAKFHIVVQYNAKFRGNRETLKTNFGENGMTPPCLSLNLGHGTLDPAKGLRLAQGTQQLLKERKTSIQFKKQTSAGRDYLVDNRVTLNHAGLSIVLYSLNAEFKKFQIFIKVKIILP